MKKDTPEQAERRARREERSRRKKATMRARKLAKKSKRGAAPASITDRDRRYRDNMKRDGFRHVRVFVPAADAAAVREYARVLRAAWTAEDAAAKSPGTA